MTFFSNGRTGGGGAISYVDFRNRDQTGTADINVGTILDDSDPNAAKTCKWGTMMSRVFTGESETRPFKRHSNPSVSPSHGSMVPWSQ